MKLPEFFFKLLHTCEFGDSFFYWLYEKIVRTLECKCCIFYRGMSVGFFLGMLWVALIFKTVLWLSE
jgi:hypothetical protein